MALSLPKFAMPKLALPKLGSPKLALDKNRLPALVGGVVVLAAAGWFGWQYFADEAAPPPAPAKPQAAVAPKPPPKAATPAGSEQARDKLVADVLVASGLKQELELLPERLLAGVRQSGKQRTKTSPAVSDAIEAAVNESFTAGGFENRVSAALKKDFEQKRLQALLQDFSTPAAKTMIELARAEQSPKEFAAYARSAAARRPAPERAALIRRIDAATRASDLAVETAFASMKALAMGLVGAGAGAGAGKADAVDKEIERQRAATTRKIRDATLLNLAFSFRDASDADLEKYAGIYETQNSKWFHGLVYAAVLDEVQAASAKAGERIGKLEIRPMAVAARGGGPKAGADARACLDFATNTAIIRCAEAYR